MTLASIVTSAATAALVGLLFAGTIGVDGVAIVWAALAWADLPVIVIQSAAGIAALGMAVLTARLVRSTWRVERLGIDAAQEG